MIDKVLRMLKGIEGESYNSYVERDSFTGVWGDVTREVYESTHARVFLGPPRVLPIQSSRPMWDSAMFHDPSPFREILAEFGHSVEHDASDEEQVPVFAGRVCYQSFGDKAGRKTAGEYMEHIMEVGHYSILEHSHVTMYVDRVPRYWSHEQVRHRHFNYSQLSQRFFVPDKVELIVPPALWDEKNIAQEFLDYGEEVGKKYFNKLSSLYDDIGSGSFALKKTSREAARAILPECTETKIVITGNLRSWYEYLQKRDSPEADAAFQEVAKLVRLRLEQVAPNVFRKEEG